MSENQKNTGIMLGAVIGDALCTPLEGLSAGHIRSVFGHIRDYADPEPALRGKMHRWRKPALYSSLSQMTLLLLMTDRTPRGADMGRFMEIISNAPSVEGSAFGVFRHPGPAERALLERLTRKTGAVPPVTCARTAAITAPFAAITEVREGGAPRGLEAALVFNRDPVSIAAALVFGGVLRSLRTETAIPAPEPLFEIAAASAELLATEIDGRSDLVFRAGLNPETLLRATTDFRDLFRELGRRSGIDAAVPLICSAVNRHVKSPITRATVNHPLALPPFALVLCGAHHDAPESALFAAADGGGACGILASLCGSLAGAAAGKAWISDGLLDGLVNRRRLLDIVETAARNRAAEGHAREFLAAEAPLTRKEIEEYTARNRRRPTATKKPGARKDAERELSRHVVESWTKVDKARWKKEKRHGDDD
ncbi:MAG TPA: ADP-ribosylglycohydrolase family protein [Spirochaetota bacterium]|nr:ADP-ribosylglycohydrolase family protein [Spirochaetota bacterium]